MYLQVISVINVIDDKMVNAMKVYLICDPLIGILWSLRKDEVTEYDKLVASLMGIGSYSRNLCKLDLDLENQGTLPVKPSVVEPPQLD